MLGFATKTELVAVELDEAVMAAAKPLQDAQTRLEKQETRERRLIAVVTGTAEQPTNEEYQAAQDQLAVRKGTQTGWYLPEAQAAREGIVSLRVAHNEAVQRAKAQLVEAGMVRLKALCAELNTALQEPMKLAAKIQDLRQEVGDCGGDLGEHPCSVLMPGGLLAGQLELMKSKGLI